MKGTSHSQHIPDNLKSGGLQVHHPLLKQLQRRAACATQNEEILIGCNNKTTMITEAGFAPTRPLEGNVIQEFS